MKNRVALVTGASSGIGWAIASHLADKGITTVAAARRLQKMAPLAEQGIHTVQLDVTNSQSIDACLATIRKDIGQIDILVNNAGVETMGPLELIPLERGRELFEVNFFGAVEMTRRCLPQMRERRWGRVINISSTGGVITVPHNGWYHASKHALEGFTKTLRQEVAEFGISASIIRPGAIESEIFDDVSDAQQENVKWNDDYQESVDKVIGFTLAVTSKSSKFLRKPDCVARAVYRSITDHCPKVAYNAPLHAKVAVNVPRYLTQSMTNTLIRKSLGVKSSVTPY